ncbi:MAG: permease prefix domain 1-containing protein [Candidatus Onthomonas sp.]
MAEELRMEQYLQKVEEQIRWKRARTAVTRELRQHLEDQKEVCLAAGFRPEEAEDEAVRQMGDPVPVGRELDRLHRPRPQWGLIALTLALVAVGMGLSLLTAESLAEAARNRLPGLLVGGVLCVLVYFWDCRSLFRHPFGWACLFALVPVGTSWLYRVEVNYFNYGTWLGLIFLPLSFALMVYAMRGKGYKGLMACGLGCLALLLLCASVPSLTDMLNLTVIATILLLAAIRKDIFRLKNKAIGTLLVTVPVLAAALVGLCARSERMEVLLHPERYVDTGGFAAVTVRHVLDAAQWLGAGSGAVDWFEPDFVREYYLLTWVAWRWGKAAALGIVLLLAAFLVWGFHACFRQRTVLGQMASAAILLAFSFQTLHTGLNCLGVPLGRFYLPLLTESNALTVLELALIGLLLSLFRQRDLLRDTAPQPRRPRVKKTYTFTVSI